MLGCVYILDGILLYLKPVLLRYICTVLAETVNAHSLINFDECIFCFISFMVEIFLFYLIELIYIQWHQKVSGHLKEIRKFTN